MLNTLSSQALTGLAVGESAETLLLDPNGRLEYAMRVLDDGVETLLLLEARGTARAESVAREDALHAARGDHRSHGRVRDRRHDGGSTRLPSHGARAPNGVALVWRDPWSGVVSGGSSTLPPPDIRVPTGSGAKSRAAGRPGALRDAALPARLPLRVCWPFEALRIAAWRPRVATEVDEKAFPTSSTGFALRCT
jgi:hypothetical protein